jgi:hypothetical protein
MKQRERASKELAARCGIGAQAEAVPQTKVLLCVSEPRQISLCQILAVGFEDRP